MNNFLKVFIVSSAFSASGCAHSRQVTFHVQLEDGQPVVGAVTFLSRFGGNPLVAGDKKVEAVDVTDRDGMVSYDLVDGASYDIRVVRDKCSWESGGTMVDANGRLGKVIEIVLKKDVCQSSEEKS
jgi:hypothetical protein